MQSPNAFRGMRDVLPGEMELRQRVLESVRSTYRRHGFLEIETPAIESIHHLVNSNGGENEKLIFKTLKRGEKLDLTSIESVEDLVDGGLRFDLTVPLARYYGANHSRIPDPFRAIQIGPVWRAERPQKGRYRQFYQVDIDILGQEAPISELELLLASSEALCEVGLTGFEVRINDRRILEALIGYFGIQVEAKEAVFIALDKLDKVPRGEVEKELISKGVLAKSIGSLIDSLTGTTHHEMMNTFDKAGVSREVLENLERVIHALGGGRRAYSVVLDPLVIRGMGYYTSMVFELSHPRWNSSIAGGGRYDKMLSRFGQAGGACGISIGFERLIALLLELRQDTRSSQRRLSLIYDPNIDLENAFEKAATLRNEGYLVTMVAHEGRKKSPIKRLAMEAEELRSQGSVGGVWRYWMGVDDVPQLLLK